MSVAEATQVLVVGATGMTGRQVVQQLLERGVSVHAIVRSPENLNGFKETHSEAFTISQGTVLDMSNEELNLIVKDCQSVVSCLGHTLSFSGIYGGPRFLCTDTAKRLIESMQETASKNDAPMSKKKFILMNSNGCVNPGVDKPIGFGERTVLSILRNAVPPHYDNESAAAYLRQEVNNDSHPFVEWTIVRPSTLLNEEKTTYSVTASPVVSAIFGESSVSRANVAQFMSDLVLQSELWTQWKSQSPVVYDADDVCLRPKATSPKSEL